MASKKLGALTPFLNEAEMVEAVKEAVGDDIKTLTAIVMGSLGRSRTGAMDLFREIGLEESVLFVHCHTSEANAMNQRFNGENGMQWDQDETIKSGPFQEIIERGVFVNCIRLSLPIPPLVTHGQIQRAGSSRRLSVDVSCRTTDPHDPIPVYSSNTMLAEPTVDVGWVSVLSTRPTSAA